jgi:hypothetical protein
MDLTGVRASAFDASNPEHATRYKLFTEPELRRVVFNRLCLQFTATGACREGAQVRLALVCGEIGVNTWRREHGAGTEQEM